MDVSVDESKWQCVENIGSCFREKRGQIYFLQANREISMNLTFKLILLIALNMTVLSASAAIVEATGTITRLRTFTGSSALNGSN